MIGWLIALALLVLLAIAPLGVSAKYDAGGPLVRLIAGPVKVTVFPGKKKEKSSNKNSGHSVPKQKTQKKDKKQTESGGNLTDFLPLVQIVLDLLDDFRWKLRVNRLDLKLILAGDDPCDLAVNYGRAWAAVGNLFPLLERSVVIHKRNVEVECDFTADKTLVSARLDLTITLGRLLALCGKHGVRALREFLKIMKSRKGGALK